MAVSKAELGKKYTCFNCETKFYDLNRDAAICPKCGSNQQDNPDPNPLQALLERYQRSAGALARKKGRGRKDEEDDLAPGLEDGETEGEEDDLDLDDDDIDMDDDQDDDLDEDIGGGGGGEDDDW